MKKLLSIILLAALFLMLAGCGSKADPNCGVYEARSANLDGTNYSIKRVYEDGFSIELKDGGRATLRIDENEYKLEWTREGNDIKIKGSDAEFSGTISDGIMVLKNFSDSGMDFTLICEDLLAQSEYSKYWNGRWYGWRVFYDGWGEYADYVDTAYDVVADIIVNGKTGNISIWDFESSEDELLMNAGFTLEEGSTKYGKLVIDQGMYGMELGDEKIVVDPGESTVSSVDHMIEIRGVFTDPENEDNGFEYIVFLRPWGMTWEDVEKAESKDFVYADMMPGCYNEYLVAIGVLDKVPEEETDDEEFGDDEGFDEGFMPDGSFGDVLFGDDIDIGEPGDSMTEIAPPEDESPEGETP